MDIGSGDKQARKFAYKRYTINLVGKAFLEDPQPDHIPSSLDVTQGNFLTPYMAILGHVVLAMFNGQEFEVNIKILIYSYL